MISSASFRRLAFALAGLVSIVVSARAAEETPWRVDASLNLFLAGMSGDVAAKGLPAAVDLSFNDIFNHTDAVAAGRFTAARGPWLGSVEFSYLKVGASGENASVDMEQWLVEPTVGYSPHDNLTLFAGLRYNRLDGEVTLHGPQQRASTGRQDWSDPILGTEFTLPFAGGRWSFGARLDVGGFGVSSEITWQAHPRFTWHFTDAGSLQLGYRWLGTDYETGSGPNRFRYDVVLQGPQIGLAYRF